MGLNQKAFKVFCSQPGGLLGSSLHRIFVCQVQMHQPAFCFVQKLFTKPLDHDRKTELPGALNRFGRAAGNFFLHHRHAVVFEKHLGLKFRERFPPVFSGPCFSLRFFHTPLL